MDIKKSLLQLFFKTVCKYVYMYVIMVHCIHEMFY